jgi:hypothetical protein
VFYIFGEHSDLSAAEFRADKMEFTGTGTGGSGGAKEGRVQEVVIKGTGHLIPMEKIEETGMQAAGWIGREMARWAANEGILKEAWESVPEDERYILSKRTMETLDGMGLMRKMPQNPAKL